MRNFLYFLFVLIGASAHAQEYGTGMIWDEASYRSVPYKAQFTASTYENLPSRISLEKYAPYPGNQGQYGTCVAFASAYGLRTIMWAKDNKIVDKPSITANALSPSFVYYVIKQQDDSICNKGANPKLGLEALKVLGAPQLSSLPYMCNPQITKAHQMEAVDYRIRDYQTLFFFGENESGVKTNSTRKALSEGYPVLLGMKLPESFFKAVKVFRSKPEDKGTLAKKHGYHAMVIVGYDDDYEGGAFRVLNSWGTQWGDGGFIWIPYSEYEEWAIGAFQPYSYYKKTDEQKPEIKPLPDVKPDKEDEDDRIAGKLPKGSMRFEQNTGKDMPVTRVSTRNLFVEDDIEGEDLVAYRMTDSYPSGTRFRFYLDNENEGYIYAFATDESKKINQILPFDDGMSPLISANSSIAFPSEKKVIRMDNNPGTDYLLLLFSQQKLDINQLKNALSQAEGSLTSKIRIALGDKLIDKADVKYSAGKAGFEVNDGANGYVVPVMVELKHD